MVWSQVVSRLGFGYGKAKFRTCTQQLLSHRKSCAFSLRAFASNQSPQHTLPAPNAYVLFSSRCVFIGLGQCNVVFALTLSCLAKAYGYIRQVDQHQAVRRPGPHRMVQEA